MEIVEIVEGALYAIRWPNEETHSLNQMAERLTDADWLYDYFQENKNKLSFFGGITIKKAVQKTYKEANEIIQELWDLASLVYDENEDLNTLFEPLHKVSAYQHQRYHTDFKAKGAKAPWVRIYAVKCDDNLYVITGWGIKLVRTMQEDKWLKKELDKLEHATNYLKENGML